MPKESDGLKVEYIKPTEFSSEQDEHKRLVKFVTLFAQVGFREFCLNPDSSIEFNYCQK